MNAAETVPPNAAPVLAPNHAELIAASAINAEVAAKRGYRTVRTAAELLRLGFSDGQARVPALLVPVWSVHGEVGLYQIRPDQPRAKDGTALKYETQVRDAARFADDARRSTVCARQVA